MIISSVSHVVITHHRVCKIKKTRSGGSYNIVPKVGGGTYLEDNDDDDGKYTPKRATVKPANKG